MGDGNGEPRKPGLRKSSLKPGMLVRNANTGTIGEVRGDPDKPKKLAVAAPSYVQISVRLKSGRLTYRFWLLENLCYRWESYRRRRR